MKKKLCEQVKTTNVSLAEASLSDAGTSHGYCYQNTFIDIVPEKLHTSADFDKNATQIKRWYTMHIILYYEVQAGFAIKTVLF